MDELAREEYRVLRETIRGRGGLRPVLCLAGLAAWAAVLVAVLGWVSNPVVAAVPLLLLVAAFETCRMLHLGVERIGRYIQVFYEEPAGGSAGSRLSPPCWERTAPLMSGSVPGAGGHPLFVPLFLPATAINFLAVVLPGPIPVELAAMTVPHVAFAIWMIFADRGMREQRAAEVARFRTLRDQASGPA